MTQVDHMNEKPAGREWLYDIERLKGLAILLVVWAHSYDPRFPLSALTLRQGIYEFHMPLFMFLSGYVFVYTGSQLLKGGFLVYTGKRLKRILLPFFVMAAIILIGKVFFQNFMAVGKPVSDIQASVEHLFVHTDQSPVFFIWYLAVLFIFNIMTAVLHKVFRVPFTALFALGVVLYLIYLFFFYRGVRLDYFYFNRVMMHYVAFAGGCLACLHRQQWEAFVDRFWIPFMVVLLVLAIFMMGTEWRYMIVGLVSAPAFHGMIRSRLFDNNRFLLFIGTYTFAIYLLNMPFVGLIKGVATPLLSPNLFGYVIIIMATVAGVAGPIVVRMVLARFSLSRPIANAMA